MTAKKKTTLLAKKRSAVVSQKLVADLRGIFQETRSHVATAANTALTMMYWNIGRRIRRDILKGKRADYGERIVSALRTQLGWTCFRQIIAFDDPLKRDFHPEMCPVERWSVRTLRNKGV